MAGMPFPRPGFRTLWIAALFLSLAPGLPAADWQAVPQPGPAPEADPARPVTWYRCFTKVPDRWTSAGSRTLYVDSVTLTVRGIEGAWEVYLNGTRLSGAGYKLAGPIRNLPQYKVKVAFVADPDGNSIELVELGA